MSWQPWNPPGHIPGVHLPGTTEHVANFPPMPLRPKSDADVDVANRIRAMHEEWIERFRSLIAQLHQVPSDPMYATKKYRSILPDSYTALTGLKTWAIGTGTLTEVVGKPGRTRDVGITAGGSLIGMGVPMKRRDGYRDPIHFGPAGVIYATPEEVIEAMASRVSGTSPPLPSFSGYRGHQSDAWRQFQHAGSGPPPMLYRAWLT